VGLGPTAVVRLEGALAHWTTPILLINVGCLCGDRSRGRAASAADFSTCPRYVPPPARVKPMVGGSDGGRDRALFHRVPVLVDNPAQQLRSADRGSLSEGRSGIRLIASPIPGPVRTRNMTTVPAHSHLVHRYPPSLVGSLWTACGKLSSTGLDHLTDALRARRVRQGTQSTLETSTEVLKVTTPENVR
jgi:hypothetical protein